MKGIGGNLTAKIQVRSATKNEIGEQVKTWTDIQNVKGFLDLSGGESKYTSYDSKIQESTHVWIMDYVALNASINTENSRMVINNQYYDIVLIDNPMELNAQIEIYLKYTGGQ
ncbi:head-tail adaptor protein [Treponema sp.]|uniref:phage head completion protein n=1 Tax=Treponema sp. TaxID=166 RepID=UPI0038904208